MRGGRRRCRVPGRGERSHSRARHRRPHPHPVDLPRRPGDRGARDTLRAGRHLCALRHLVGRHRADWPNGAHPLRCADPLRPFIPVHDECRRRHHSGTRRSPEGPDHLPGRSQVGVQPGVLGKVGLPCKRRAAAHRRQPLVLQRLLPSRRDPVPRPGVRLRVLERTESVPLALPPGDVARP